MGGGSVCVCRGGGFLLWMIVRQASTVLAVDAGGAFCFCFFFFFAHQTPFFSETA